MEYRTAIVDELEWVIFWIDELQGWEQVKAILYGHPDWTVRCIEI